MSPEQLAAKDLDARTDLFSFGAVLYEMATGMLPFRGDSTAMVTMAILQKAPTPVLRLNPDAPSKLDDVISKALEKDRNLRYQHAADMRSDLRRLKRDTDSRSGVVEVSELGAAGGGGGWAAQISSGDASGAGGAGRGSTGPLTTRAASGVGVGVGALEGSGSSSTVIVEAAKKHKIGVGAGLFIALAVIAAAGYGVYALIGGKAAPEPFENFSVTQLTNNGKTSAAAISTDGKYLLSVIAQNGQDGLWLKNIPTNSDTQVVAPAGLQIVSPEFSPDGNWMIYYRKAEKATQSAFDLYRAPVLGGASAVLRRDIDTGVSFSPDGKQMAYMRANDPDVGTTLTLIANADGSGEKVVNRQAGANVLLSVAWSPDGKQLVRLRMSDDQLHQILEVQDLKSGKISRLATPTELFLNGRPVWAPDGAGVYLVYDTKFRALKRSQIGYLAYPSERLRPITKDTNQYGSISVSGDGKTLAAVQVKRKQTFYVLPATGFSGAEPPPAGAQAADLFKFDWTPQGDVLMDNEHSIEKMSVDGSKRATLINDPAALTVAGSVCESGHYFVYEWMGHAGVGTVNVWRADMDGSNAKQLSQGTVDIAPACSADGKWIYYNDYSNQRIMRIPASGGKGEIVPGSEIPNSIIADIGFDLSKDGKTMAYLITMQPSAGQSKPYIAFLDLETGKSRLMEPDPRIANYPHYAPGEKAVVYALDDGTSNLWEQSVEGGPAKKITNFGPGRFQGRFEFSADGKQLGVLMGASESDVVLFRDEGK
jgi:Tol biopolymer transport system component